MGRHTWALLLSSQEKRVAKYVHTYIRGYTHTKGKRGRGEKKGGEEGQEKIGGRGRKRGKGGFRGAEERGCGGIG